VELWPKPGCSLFGLVGRGGRRLRCLGKILSTGLWHRPPHRRNRLGNASCVGGALDFALHPNRSAPKAACSFLRTDAQRASARLSGDGASFAGVTNLVRRELSEHRPMLLLIATGPSTWHYWSVVGHDAAASTLAVLETNQTEKSVSCERVAELMALTPYKLSAMRLGGLLGLDIGAWVGLYNCILFEREPLVA
jgi:hypothetical protein